MAKRPGTKAMYSVLRLKSLATCLAVPAKRPYPRLVSCLNQNLIVQVLGNDRLGVAGHLLKRGKNEHFCTFVQGTGTIAATLIQVKSHKYSGKLAHRLNSVEAALSLIASFLEVIKQTKVRAASFWKVSKIDCDSIQFSSKSSLIRA